MTHLFFSNDYNNYSDIYEFLIEHEDLTIHTTLPSKKEIERIMSSTRFVCIHAEFLRSERSKELYAFAKLYNTKIIAFSGAAFGDRKGSGVATPTTVISIKEMIFNLYDYLVGDDKNTLVITVGRHYRETLAFSALEDLSYTHYSPNKFELRYVEAIREIFYWVYGEKHYQEKFTFFLVRTVNAIKDFEEIMQYLQKDIIGLLKEN